MHRNVRMAVIAGIAGFGAASLAGCAAPRQYPNDRYYEAPGDRANYDAPAGYVAPSTQTTTTTSTTSYPSGTAYQSETVTTYDGPAYGKPTTYVEDDPHHYGRGPNQHKY